MTTDIQTSDWYKHLIEDCKAVIVESVFTSRWVIIEGHWKIGERLLNDLDYQKYSQDGLKLCNIAKDLGVSERSLYYSIEFYKKYPDINMLPEGKNISWHKIIQKYLTSTSGEKAGTTKLITCPKCGFEFS